jgi:hypothetical protein
MKKFFRILAKALTMIAVAFVVKFYLFDLPRFVYRQNQAEEILWQLDSLQNEYIIQLVRNNNAWIEHLKDSI